MSTTAQDTNSVIDAALSGYNEALEVVLAAIRNGHGEDAIPTLNQMSVAFARMCGLARLSVTPLDPDPRDFT